MKKLLVVIFGALMLVSNRLFAFDPSQIPQDWPKVAGKHFEVIYPLGGETTQASIVLNKAEEYYDRISARLGFNRYQDFWTWDKRVKIILYPNVEDFTRYTGQPVWSQAFSSSHAGSLGSRVIVSFNGQPDFLNIILPHELGHLLLHDFLNNTPVPVFFDEGVAQLEESRDDVNNRRIMGQLIKVKQHIPFNILVTLRPNQNFNQQAVSIFYAESLYFVDFLIKTYGSLDFAELCRQLRDGLSFEDALKKVYYPNITSLDNLEESWKLTLQQIP